MILRRIAGHLKQQHWTGAFIELAIVILGVFIGLQANNWNQARVHRADERAFLLQLREEITGDDKALRYQSRYVAQVVASGRRALAYLKGGKDCTTGCDGLLIDFFDASQVWGAPYDQTRYQQAQRLGYPSNPSTRRAVEAFYKSIGGWLAVNQTPPTYRARVRGHFTPAAAEALWQGCWRRPAGGLEELPHGCARALEKLDTTAMLREIRTDNALIPELQYWLGQNILALTFYPQSHLLAKAAEAAITRDAEDTK